MNGRKMRNIAIIDAHPDPDRFCHALATDYAEGALNSGHGVRRIDLAAPDFPLLRTAVDFQTGRPPVDIAAAQETIRWANHIVAIYPLWLGTMPALLKAFLEQVFRPGFGIEAGSEGWPKPLLKGRPVRIVVTMGMPALVYRWYLRAHGLKSLERNILKLAGLALTKETLFAAVETVSPARRESWLSAMRRFGEDGE